MQLQCGLGEWGCTSTEVGVKVARSMSVWTPRRGTYTLTMVSLCSQEQVVSTRNEDSPGLPRGPAPGCPRPGPGAPGAKPPRGQAGAKPLPARGCAPWGGIQAAAVTGAGTTSGQPDISENGRGRGVACIQIAAFAPPRLRCLQAGGAVSLTSPPEPLHLFSPQDWQRSQRECCKASSSTTLTLHVAVYE